MNKSTVLIIDDEIQIIKLLEITLQSHDFSTDFAKNGNEGLIKCATHPPDLVLLDLGLPDIDGQQVLKKLREWFLGPVIILSVRNSEEEIVEALEAGANDFLSKPFRTKELIARIRSAMKHSMNDQSPQILDFSDLTINLVTRTVKLENQSVKLTATEYNLLVLLAKNDGKVLTHSYILKTIWGPSYFEQAQYLRVFIGQLRKKIEKNPEKPQYIHTESGIGYRFAERKPD